MQYVQALLQPSCTFTPTRVGNSAPTRTDSDAAIASSKRLVSLPLGTTDTRSLMDAYVSGSMAAAQPVTTTRAESFARKAWRTALRVFFSASPVTVQVFTMMRSASERETHEAPWDSRRAAKSSLSTRLTLQPRLTI